MAKRAVLIGCNYPGTKAELHGCVNDVSRMYKCLVDRFDFAEDDITVMVDTDKRSVQPTGANIKKVLSRVIQQSEPGDVLVLHYSGHGTQVPAESGDDEDDGLDEAIVPTDLNIMTDDDFRILFTKIQHGVLFTFISDSCHSGGLIDHETEQIGGGDGGSRSFQSPVPAQSRGAYGAGSRDYGGGYNERESGEYEGRGEIRGHHEYGGGYGRREEQDYESREETRGHREHHGDFGRREEPEYESSGQRYGNRGGFGEYGRREEPEYESRGERYGQRGGFDEYGRREEPEYESRAERHEHHHRGRREEPAFEEYEPRRGQEYEPRRGQEYGYRHERREQEDDYGRRVPFNNKSLSIETLTEMLSQQAGHEVKPGNIRTSLYGLFGEDASPTVKVFVNLIASRLSGDGGAQGSGGGIWGSIGGLAMDFMKAKLNDSDSNFAHPAQVISSAVSQSGHAGAKPSRSQRVADDVGVLISGCQSNETSADANPSGNSAQAYGALSNGIQTILAQKRGPITNGEIVTEVRALLKQQGFSQHPCLYSSDANVNAPFICE